MRPVYAAQEQYFGSPSRHGWRGVVRRAIHRKSTWIVLIPVLLVVVAGGGFFAYLSYLNSNAPAPLSFADAPPLPGDQGAALATPEATTVDGAPVELPPADAGAADGGATSPSAGGAAVAPSGQASGGKAPSAGTSRSEVEGRWIAGPNSLSGYRIGYSAVGVKGTRVGRTKAGDGATKGEFNIAGTVLQSATFSVEMRKVECDGGSQCTDHVNEIMDVANHPHETFSLSKPVDLGSIPADGQQIQVSITGQLTLRGVTRSVTFPLTARRNGAHIEVLGSIPVNRDDYKIPDSNEPGFSIDKDGLVELLLVFDRG